MGVFVVNYGTRIRSWLRYAIYIELMLHGPTWTHLAAVVFNAPSLLTKPSRLMCLYSVKNQSSPIAVPRQPRSLRSKDRKDIASGNPYTPFLGKLDLPWRIYAFGLGSCYLVNFNFTLLPKRLPQHGRVELAGGHHHPGNFCEVIPLCMERECH